MCSHWIESEKNGVYKITTIAQIAARYSLMIISSSVEAALAANKMIFEGHLTMLPQEWC